MALTSSISDDGKVLTIVLEQRFDFNAIHEFRDIYSSGISGVEHIVVDLVKTEYMDSSALGMLLNMQKSTQDRVSEFSIVNPNPRVAKILKISRFDKKFNIVENR